MLKMRLSIRHTMTTQADAAEGLAKVLLCSNVSNLIFSNQHFQI
jgi:hypothetical protein